MKRFRLLPFLHFVVFLLPLAAQDNLRTQLFGEADRIMGEAKQKNADLYAPRSYARAMEYYREGEASLQRGNRLEDIRTNLQNSSAYFAKALDACKLGEVTLSSTMGARTDANSAGAPKFSAELWMKAEEQFKRAARSLEDGDINDARDKGKEAETTYRTSELEAIKANFLTPARELLNKAEEMDVRDTAPRTLKHSQDLVAQVEALLTQKRYDTDEARQRAQEAKYEAAHAIYLHQTIRSMQNEDKTFEDAMLADEAQFQRVAGALGVQARFDNGYNTPVSECLSALKEKEKSIAAGADKLVQAAEAIRQKENEVANLRQQVELMEKRLGTLTEAERQLQDAGKALERTLALKRQQEEVITQVSNAFTDAEGNVLRDNNNVIIRLYGLSFPVGRSAIEPEYYALLTKVQEAVKKFPNSNVTIEGHTDSQGSDDANQSLSEARAKAVAEYLMANMNVLIPINSQGYGESRPVASNDTPEGRAKNRRIDVLITPDGGGK